MNAPSTELRHRARLLACLLALALSACGQSSPSLLAVEEATLARYGPSTDLEVRLRHEFGPELLKALHQGVNLRYLWQLELQGPPRLLGSSLLARRQGSLEVGYRSFTRWYTLYDSLSDRRTALPDITETEHALDELRLRFPELTGALASAERARFRIQLDIGALPPPLRLPAYLSSEWRLDSGWHAWSLNENGEG